MLILHITAYCLCPFQNLLGEPSDIRGAVCLYCTLRYIAFAPFRICWESCRIFVGGVVSLYYKWRHIAFAPFGVYRTSLYTIVPSSFILRGGDACIPVLRSRATNTPAHTDGRARLRYLRKYACVAVTVTGGSASSVRFPAAFCSSVLPKQSALHAIYTKYIKMGIDLKAAGC